MTSKLSKMQKYKEYVNQLIQSQLLEEKKKTQKVVNKQMKEFQTDFKQNIKDINNSNNKLKILEQVIDNSSDEYFNEVLQEFGSVESFLEEIMMDLPSNLTKIEPEQKDDQHIIMEKQSNIYNYVNKSVEDLKKQTSSIYKKMKIAEEKTEQNREVIIDKFLKNLEWIKNQNPEKKDLNIYSVFQNHINSSSSYMEVAKKVIEEYTGDTYAQINNVMTNQDPLIQSKSNYLLNLILKNYRTFDAEKRIGSAIGRKEAKVLYRNIRLPKELLTLYQEKQILFFTNFTSTSINPIFKIYSDEKYWRVEFQIKMLTYQQQKQNNFLSGLFVDQISKHQGENEVIFFPYQFFKITKIVKMAPINKNDKFGYHQINLEELNDKDIINDIDTPLEEKQQQQSSSSSQNNKNGKINIQAAKQKLTSNYLKILDNKKSNMKKKQELGKKFNEKIQEIINSKIIKKIEECELNVDEFLINALVNQEQFSKNLEISQNELNDQYIIYGQLQDRQVAPEVVQKVEDKQILLKVEKEKWDIKEKNQKEYEKQLNENKNAEIEAVSFAPVKIDDNDHKQLYQVLYNTAKSIYLQNLINVDEIFPLKDIEEINQAEILLPKGNKAILQLDQQTKKLFFNVDEKNYFLEKNELYQASLTILDYKSNRIIKVVKFFAPTTFNLLTGNTEVIQNIGNEKQSMKLTEDQSVKEIMKEHVEELKSNRFERSKHIEVEKLIEGVHKTDQFQNFIIESKKTFQNHSILICCLYPYENLIYDIQQTVAVELDKLGFKYKLITTIGEIFTQINDFTQLWIIDTNNRVINEDQLQKMGQVISSKKSIYFFTDNAPYFTNVNLILNNYFGSMQMTGNYIGTQIIIKSSANDGKIQKQQFDGSMQLGNLLNNIYEGYTISHPINIHKDFKIFAFNSENNPLIIFSEQNHLHGRIIIDTGFTKLMKRFWDTAGTNIYIKNAAIYLTEI